jgi:hypothetical protein
MTLTPPVAAALPALVEAIVDDARRLGFRFARRPTRVWRHGAGPVDGVQADGMLESMAIGSREGLDATISAPTGKRR